MKKRKKKKKKKKKKDNEKKKIEKKENLKVDINIIKKFEEKITKIINDYMKKNSNIPIPE